MKKTATLLAGLALAAAAYAEIPEAVTALPDGVAAQQWLLSYERSARWVDVAFDGNDVYLGNIVEDFPGLYVRGSLDGTTVAFPITHLGQFEDVEGTVDLYFVPVEWKENEYVDDFGEYVDDYFIAASFAFNYDAAKSVMTSAKPNSAIFISDETAVGNLAGGYLEVYLEPRLYIPDPADADAPLATPEFIEAFHDEWYDCDIVNFYLSSLNTKGYPIPTEELFYIFYIDDEPLTLTPEVYVGLDEDMTEIPFSFRDWENQDVWCYRDDEHQIALYPKAPYKTVGVKMLRKDAEGKVVAETELVRADIYELSEGTIGEEDSLEAIAAGTATVVSTQWFDLNGRRLTAPLPGLTLRVDTLSDGRRVVSKHIVR